MKLAYTVGTTDTREGLLAYHGDCKEIFTKLKEIGYQGVELFIRNPYEMDQDKVSRELENCGLELVAIGTGPIASQDKLNFTAEDEGVRLQAIERAKAIIDFAAPFGAQVNIGTLRGNIHKGNSEQCRRWQKEAFQVICEHASHKKINITVEPQNRFVIDNLNTTQQAIAWVKEQHLENLYIMSDVFHMNIEDQSIAASLIEARDHSIHVHFADNNRSIPGSGHINFAEIVRILKAIGYNRYICVEIDQVPNSFYAAKQAFSVVDALLKRP